MGASHSIIGNQDSIPVGLVIKILLYLSVADLTSCRSVNCTLNNIIDGLPHIQHQISTALAGVVDNPSATLPFPERRRALAHRQEAWDNYKPQFTTTSKVPTTSSFPDFIQEGVYFKPPPWFPQSCWLLLSPTAWAKFRWVMVLYQPFTKTALLRAYRDCCLPWEKWSYCSRNLVSHSLALPK